METAVNLSDLQQLGQHLQAALLRGGDRQTPLGVQCALKQGVLMVLVEHDSAEPVAAPAVVFGQIEQALGQIRPAIAPKARLYLRRRGEQQPYESASIAWAPPRSAMPGLVPPPPPPSLGVAPPPAAPSAAPEATDSPALEEDAFGESEAIASGGLAESAPASETDAWLEDSDDSSKLDEAAIASDMYSETDFDREENPADFFNEDAESDFNLGPKAGPREDIGEGGEENLDQDPDQLNPLDPYQDEDETPDDHELAPLTPSDRRVLWPWILAGAAISVSAFAVSLYAFTRPCVLGGCPPVETAQALQQRAASVTSWQELNAVQREIAAVSEQLRAVPLWSGHRRDAQALLTVFQQENGPFQQVIAAQSKATTAAQRSQNPPHPIAEWQAIRDLWEEAIATLNQVESTSPSYGFVQEKRREYEANLAAIERRITAENLAQQRLSLAKNAAAAAETRQSTTRGVEGLQAAQQSWQTVLNQLTNIPQGTMARQEANQLKTTYQARMSQVRDLLAKEQLALDTYDEAIALANQAKSFEQKSQWTQAVIHWRQAINAAQQVPQNTVYYERAQPLINSYSVSLQAAEGQLNTAVALQEARTDLQSTCAGTPTICTYSLSNDLIQVMLTPEYEQAIFAGDSNNAVALQQHIQALQGALEAISDNTQVPLDVYYSNGTLLGSYVPPTS